jgi:hypothetical protein
MAERIPTSRPITRSAHPVAVFDLERVQLVLPIAYAGADTHDLAFRSFSCGVSGFSTRSAAQESRPSFSAQALATAELIFSVPGVVAQPPFSMRVR